MPLTERRKFDMIIVNRRGKLIFIIHFNSISKMHYRKCQHIKLFMYFHNLFIIKIEIHDHMLHLSLFKIRIISISSHLVYHRKRTCQYGFVLRAQNLLWFPQASDLSLKPPSLFHVWMQLIAASLQFPPALSQKRAVGK